MLQVFGFAVVHISILIGSYEAGYSIWEYRKGPCHWNMKQEW
jgi:hypothetical protein